MELDQKNIPGFKNTLQICGIFAGIYVGLLIVIPYLFPHFSIIIDNFTFLIELLLVIFLFRLLSKSGYNIRDTLYLNKIRKNIVPPILIISISTVLFETGFITYLQTFTNWPTFDDRLAPELTPYLFYNIFLVIGACITAPVFEELFFRGLILRTFSERFGPFWAIIISSFIFSLLHIVPSAVVGIFLAFNIVGWVVYRTKSIIGSVMIHTIWNASSMAEVIIVGNNNIKMIDDLTMPGDFVLYAAYLLSGSIGLIIGIIWLNKKTKSEENPVLQY